MFKFIALLLANTLSKKACEVILAGTVLTVGGLALLGDKHMKNEDKKNKYKYYLQGQEDARKPAEDLKNRQYEIEKELRGDNDLCDQILMENYKRKGDK